MNLVARIAAYIAPALPHRLLVLMVFRLALILREEIATARDEWRRCIAMPGLAHRIITDLCFLTGLTDWLERLARHALWTRAHQLCGQRSPEHLDRHINYPTRPATPQHLDQRLATLLARLAKIEAEAAELAAQWKRAKYTAATLPPLAGGSTAEPGWGRVPRGLFLPFPSRLAPIPSNACVRAPYFSRLRREKSAPVLRRTRPACTLTPRKQKSSTSLTRPERPHPHAHRHANSTHPSRPAPKRNHQPHNPQPHTHPHPTRISRSTCKSLLDPCSLFI
jgi:hypothetical protein